MKKFSKKIFIIILCGLLSTGIVSSSYYKSVHAFEWVGGALAFEEALKWLFAALGITATIGVGHDIWEAHSDEFIDYAIENGATQTEVANWQLKLCKGILDKSSIVWDKFKSWLSSLFDNKLVIPSLGSSDTVVLQYLSKYFNASFDKSVGFIDNVNGFILFVNNGFVRYDHLYLGTSIFLYNSNYIRFYNSCHNNNNFYVTDSNWNYINFSAGINSGVNFGLPNSIDYTIYYSSSIKDIVNSIKNKTNNLSNFIEIPFGDNVILDDTNFNTLDNITYDNLDIISSTDSDIENTEDKEVYIPFPGLSDSDDTISSDTYDDIIGRINDGAISYDDGISEIQDLLKVLVYDGVTDEVIPVEYNPDSGENETIQDKIQNIKDNMGFTLGGLENVFPFCIPFDIYSFMTLLVADPVVPVIDYPIKSVNNTTENIHIDLSPFEPVAVVVRYVFDFLFIIGLGVLTRSLIGAGGSD